MTAPNRINGRTAEELGRMCSNKHRYSDEFSARAGAMQSLDRWPTTYRLFTYRCPACRGYHLTKVKQPGQEPVTLEPQEIAA